MKVAFPQFKSDGSMSLVFYGFIRHCRPCQSELVIEGKIDFTQYMQARTYAERHGLRVRYRSVLID
jgi:hypothetical protein